MSEAAPDPNDSLTDHHSRKYLVPQLGAGALLLLANKTYVLFHIITWSPNHGVILNLLMLLIAVGLVSSIVCDACKSLVVFPVGGLLFLIETGFMRNISALLFNGKYAAESFSFLYSTAAILLLLAIMYYYMEKRVWQQVNLYMVLFSFLVSSFVFGEINAWSR